MLRLTVLTLVCLALVGGSQAVKLDKCQIYRALKAQGFPESELQNWVCLVLAESGGDTSIKGKVNKNGSYDHGLFQINDKYWCRNGSAGGDCKVKCEDLRNDNISDDAACAKKIKQRHGFGGWYGWKKNCDRKPLPDVSKC